jgi:pyridoxal phosphate enzyme (YggS family)
LKLIVHAPEPAMTDARTQTSSATAAEIAVNLADVRRRMAEAAARAGRDMAAITLVAIAKTHSQAAVRAALAAGQNVFGENRVQEAEAKYPALRSESQLELHLVGPLQTNKVRQALGLFDMIETVDREKLARALASELQKTDRRPAFLIEVNTGEEPQKAGVTPVDADRFIALCRDELRLPVTGLMCVPPLGEEPAPHFALLAKIAKRNGLALLSMGMSADFEIAIEFGATHVRIGTAIFGGRA